MLPRNMCDDSFFFFFFFKGLFQELLRSQAQLKQTINVGAKAPKRSDSDYEEILKFKTILPSQDKVAFEKFDLELSKVEDLIVKVVSSTYI